MPLPSNTRNPGFGIYDCDLDMSYLRGMHKGPVPDPEMTHFYSAGKANADANRRALPLDEVVRTIAYRYRWDELRKPVAQRFVDYRDMPRNERSFMEALDQVADQYDTLGQFEDASGERTVPEQLMSRLSPVPKGIRNVLVRGLQLSDIHAGYRAQCGRDAEE